VHVFHNPVASGSYHFVAVVTSLSPAGAPDPAIAFGMLGDERLPQTLSETAAYDQATGTLTVHGRLDAAGSPRGDVQVSIYVEPSLGSTRQKQAGVAITASDGTFTFTGKVPHPGYVFAFVPHYDYYECQQRVAAKGGCSSETVDGIVAAAVRVS
jgi:hypothetical protein